MRFTICNEIFSEWSLEKAMQFAYDTGYEALEIAPFTLANSVTDLSSKERARIRKCAEDIGIAISGIHWVLVKPEGLYINHTDPSIRQRTADYFYELVDFCADLGGHHVVIGSPKQRQVLPELSKEQAKSLALDTFRPALAQAEKRDVTLCFEPLSPAETNFINTAEEAIDFVKSFESDRFKIILDVKAMCSESKSIPEIIQDSAGQFAYFHANDRNLKGPGFGEVDFIPIFKALQEAKYSGHVSVEVFNFEEGAEVIAQKSLAYMKSCLPAV